MEERQAETAIGSACQAIADAQAQLRAAMGATLADPKWAANRERQHKTLERMVRAHAKLEEVGDSLTDPGWDKP